jgi:ribosomal protein S27AE
MNEPHTKLVKAKVCPLCGKQTLMARDKLPMPTLYCRDCKRVLLIMLDPKFQEQPK